MKAFWELVRNDCHFQGMNPPGLKSWFWVLGSILLVASASNTILVIQNFMKPVYFLYGLPSLLFVAFTLPLYLIWKERAQATRGWWLSLPYPRSTLIAAKMMTSILLLIGLAFITYSFITLFLIQASLLRPDDWGGEVVLDVLSVTIQWILVLILVSPLPVVLGLLVAIVQQSRWNRIAPLLWLFVILAANGLGWTIFGALQEKIPEQTIQEFSPLLLLSVQPIVALMLLLLGVVIAILLFLVSVYVLDRHAET